MGYFLPLFYPVVDYTFPVDTMQLGSWSFFIATEAVGACILYGSIRFKDEIINYRNRVVLWIKKSLNFSKRTRRKRKK